MEIVPLEQIPLDEEDPHGWWERNRARLRQLRELARSCGAGVYGDDMPATHMERYRLELEARGQTPTRLEVLALGGGPDALRSDAVTSLTGHGWYLFRRRPTGLVARALEQVSPVRLALAVRAWDPEPLQPASTEAELRGHRKRLHQMNERIRHLEAACVDEPCEVVRIIPNVGVQRTPQGLIMDVLRELRSQRDTFSSWIEYRTRLALSTMRAEEAIRRLVPGERLPHMIERQISDARRRWWNPAATTLRSSGWRDGDLAKLLLDEQWVLDLVPYTRIRYQGDPRHPALLEQFRNIRRPERAHVSRRAPRTPRKAVR